jgi:hypothetical protein
MLSRPLLCLASAITCRNRITKHNLVLLKTWVGELAPYKVLLIIVYIKSYFQADIHLNNFFVKIVYH